MLNVGAHELLSNRKSFIRVVVLSRRECDLTRELVVLSGPPDPLSEVIHGLHTRNPYDATRDRAYFMEPPSSKSEELFNGFLVINRPVLAAVRVRVGRRFGIVPKKFVQYNRSRATSSTLVLTTPRWHPLPLHSFWGSGSGLSWYSCRGGAAGAGDTYAAVCDMATIDGGSKTQNQ